MWRHLIVSLLLLGGCKSMSFKPLLPATLGVVGGGIGALGGNPVTAGLGAGLGAGAGTLLVQGSDKVESEVRVLKALTTGDVNKVVEAKLDEAKDNGFFDGVLTEVYGVIKLCVIGLGLWILVPMIYTHWHSKKQKEKWKKEI